MEDFLGEVIGADGPANRTPKSEVTFPDDLIDVTRPDFSGRISPHELLVHPFGHRRLTGALTHDVHSQRTTIRLTTVAGILPQRKKP